MAASPSPHETATELRCFSKLFGILKGDLLEIKCNSDRCGAGAGVVVLHYFDLKGNFVDTKLYKDPGRIKR